MQVKKVVVGKLQTNCYALIKNNKCLIIDPGDEINKIIEMIDNNKLVGIIITHYHFDHVGALKQLKSKYNVEVYDVNNLTEGINTIDEFNFSMIVTKGHDNTCITLYFENIMFTGDFIFKGSIGRYDLENSNLNDMIISIKKIINYNDNIIIYPGHGDSTILGLEKNKLRSYVEVIF